MIKTHQKYETKQEKERLGKGKEKKRERYQVNRED